MDLLQKDLPQISRINADEEALDKGILVLHLRSICISLRQTFSLVFLRVSVSPWGAFVRRMLQL
jgi:hypothetical protein